MLGTNSTGLCKQWKRDNGWQWQIRVFGWKRKAQFSDRSQRQKKNTGPCVGKTKTNPESKNKNQMLKTNSTGLCKQWKTAMDEMTGTILRSIATSEKRHWRVFWKTKTNPKGKTKTFNQMLRKNSTGLCKQWKTEMDEMTATILRSIATSEKRHWRVFWKTKTNPKGKTKTFNQMLRKNSTGLCKQWKTEMDEMTATILRSIATSEKRHWCEK